MLVRLNLPRELWSNYWNLAIFFVTYENRAVLASFGAKSATVGDFCPSTIYDS